MRAALCLTVFVTAASGCSKSEVTGGADTEVALIVALQSDGQTLDPHLANDAPSMRLVENVYCTLLRYGEQPGELVGDLALRWERSEDGLRYTFELDPRARFHGSHRPVTSADVAWSVERIRRLGVRSQQFDAVERVETPAPHTVVFVLRAPTAAFETWLAYPMNAIVDRVVVERHADRLDNVTAGSGAFEMVTWERNRRLLLASNRDYHLGAPPLERIELRPISDDTARINALRAGEVQLVLEVPVREVDRLKAHPDLVLRSVPGTFWEYVGMNVRRPALRDARVRQAIASAIDREVVAALVKRGQATPLVGGHLPPNHWAHADIAPYAERDLEEARRLLREAGAPRVELILKVGSAFNDQVRAAEVVKQQLREAGIDVRIESLESGVFFDALGRGDFDLTVVGWVGFVDPDEWTFEIFHSAGKWNQQGYDNAEVDALLEAGRRETNREARARLYARAQTLIARDAPMAFLYVNPQISAWVRGLVGFEVDPTASTRSLVRAHWAKGAQ